MRVLFIGGTFDGKTCEFPDNKHRFAQEYHSFAVVQIQGVTVKLVKPFKLAKRFAWRRFHALWNIDRPDGHKPDVALWQFRNMKEVQLVYNNWWTEIV